MTNEELVYLYRQGDKQALEILIEQNKSIIYKLANRFYTEGTNAVDKEDLIQEGYLGLIAAADKYDFDNEKKAKFITYAVFWVNSKISRFINTRATKEEISLNSPIGDDDSSQLMDYIEGEDYSLENVEERIYIKELREELEQAMNDNTSLKERETLKLHYGWNNGRILSFGEIGSIFNIDDYQVKRIEGQALRKIRHSSWGRRKANELYGNRIRYENNSIAAAIENIDFFEKYLS
ncbi:sigma-70 family RNA polymerase sigma factor [Clostridium sp. 19966]|uniref:sigma-70 family RNA polymerase sigma factor n=1 Tax=Clostridium sp. 19966 TaxID=2768166 RepID=UPI0028DEDA25|nr:sigma-70 family RNA polymerase sigma factor [Clostridium sp. 19966]MDT8715545.1 sigma-70 family RNA polymerase sigma factor [Clostridium sp. 19966]